MKLAKTYDPKEYEDDIYALWEKTEAFKPKARGSKETYSIVIPPPNANGDLHLGHGLTLALEDIAIRYHRMLGKKTLFLPGADHAGFETQVVYEKRLALEGKSRFDYKREELHEQIYGFVSNTKDNYESQFRRTGASLDWSRYIFSLDQKIINQAYTTFKRMWDEKLIYRGERLVNYCTFHGTGFADIEVNYEDTVSPLYYMKYGPFTLATTRPETKFGDTAVAIHPDDKRYKEWIGKTVTVEGVNGPFEIRVVADEMVDPKFGTGVVKITPAHDFNDWEVAQRHNLEAKKVIDRDGTLNHHAGRFAGLTVVEGRKAVVKALEEKNLLEKVDKKYKNRVGKCYKCGTVIEPMLLEQWFISMKRLAEPAIKALKTSEIKFYPESKKKQLVTYLENLKDWNISRQIAWGIPIPAFRNVDDPEDWIFDTRVDQETLEINGQSYHRDPDVFDTWFSSSSWPYATLDYPNGSDFNDFYPLSVMETGADILFPWVSRMIMFGLYSTGKIPFEKVYLHGLILDPEGAKMSKSKGNVVSPMDKIDKYGSDGFRMGIVASATAGSNQAYDESKLVAGRNFANKIWNVSRFIEDTIKMPPEDTPPAAESLADHWVLFKIEQGVKTISSHLDNYRFSEAYQTLYHLIWDDIADWYIESSKKKPNVSVLAYVLRTSLKLAHPFAPFVTETIWQTLHAQDDSLLITSSWPIAVKSDKKAAEEFEKIRGIVSEIRQIKTRANLKRGAAYFTKSEFLNSHKELVAKLAKLDDIKQVYEGKGINLVGTTENIWVEVDDETAQMFREKLNGRHKEIKSQLKVIDSRLSNDSYVKKAPKELVAESKIQKNILDNELKAIEKQLAKLGDLFV
jgi:valyl-tRNA synthetase